MDAPTLWIPGDQEQEPLNLQRAGLSKRWERRRLMALSDLTIYDPDDLGEEIAGARYKIAVRTRELLHDEAGIKKLDPRIIGVLWGELMMVRHRTKLIELPDVLQLMMVSTDQRYTGAAEWWMMDRLREEMPAEGFRHITVRSPVGDDDHDIAAFARRHGFQVRDVTGGMYVWQWPDTPEGVLSSVSS